MDMLYKFLTSMCKGNDMKIGDLQQKLNVSRTTLYRYMKGINRITPDMAQSFISALNMDMHQSFEFSKHISLSAFDYTLVESRHVLDDFLFGKQLKPKPPFNVDMVLYDKDKYLRTLKEILDYIFSFSSKEALTGEIKMVNCLNENIFALIAGHFEEASKAGANIGMEHFIGLSESNYLQNIKAFTYIFPLIMYEKYKLFYREKETEDSLLHDSILVSLTYQEDGKQVNQYFSITFYESGMSECVAFNDFYMYSYLSKLYENLKRSHKDVMYKTEYIDITEDIIDEIQKYGGSYIIKPNPYYDRIPYEVYVSLINRTSGDERKGLMSALSGEEFDESAIPDAASKLMQSLKKRLDVAQATKQTDVFSREGLVDFAQNGRLTDHLDYLPALNQDEKRTVLERLYNRCNDPKSAYSLYITENEMSRKGMVLEATKGFSLAIGNTQPETQEGLWKMVIIQNERLASIFCDYMENHIPVNHAMEKEKAKNFLQALINDL